MTAENQIWADVEELIQNESLVASTFGQEEVEEIQKRVYQKMLRESFRRVLSDTVWNRWALAYHILRHKSIP